MIALLRMIYSAALFLALTAVPLSSADAKSKSRRAAVNKYAALVVHADSGEVLYARYADEKRYPASLTKMMTLYLLFEEMDAGRIRLDQDLSVSAQAAGQPPSKLGLTAGSTIDTETAIKALIVKSANDAAVVIAESVAGSEWRFAQRMTEKARSLGMARTTFRNASGLPNTRQVSTARDLATLGRRLAQDFPQYYHLFATSDFAWNGRTYRTHNAVTENYPGAEGLKTGYTRTSGFNLVTAAKRDGNRLVGVVLGGRSVRTRDAHMKELLDTAFGRVSANPSLIASLYSSTPSPRIKPTLLAELQAIGAAPTINGDAALQQEIFAAAAGFAESPEVAPDAISALIAAASPDDLNEYERSRLANLSPMDGLWGEGDADGAGAALWSVQIGAYSTKELAQKELETAAVVGGFIDRERTILPASSESGGLYRARFVRLTSEDAGALCESLKSKKLVCFVVQDAAGD
jgi:D-alanyl-D-alanine carboxypeptidase